MHQWRKSNPSLRGKYCFYPSLNKTLSFSLLSSYPETDYCNLNHFLLRLKQEAGITYNVHYQELPSANRMRPVPMYIAFVRYFCRDVSKSFSSIHVNQYECEKKAYVKLLKFLSDLRLNTSGQSAMLDNASSDEDWYPDAGAIITVVFIFHTAHRITLVNKLLTCT